MFKREKMSLSSIAMAFFMFAIVLAGYHRCYAESKPAKAPAKAPVFSTADATSCASCHQMYVDSMKNEKVLLSKHSSMTKDCFSCHEKSALDTAHKNVTQAPGKLFKQRKYPNDMCLKCHGTYEKLVEKTKGSKAFIDVDGKARNPHDEYKDHNTAKGRQECFNCHKMHKEFKPIDFCYGCHHAKVLKACKDCHGSK